MGRVQEAIGRALAAEVEGRREWDEPPALYFMYLAGGGVSLGQVPVPDAIWGMSRPPDVLRWMSRATGEFSALLRAAAPEGQPGHEEAARASREHTIHLRTDKVEERALWAVDRAGITYGAMLARGSAEARTQVAYPGPQRRITGAIPEALDRIVSAVLGVTIG